MPNWSIVIEDKGAYTFTVMYGNSVEGVGSADDLDTCLDMARECYWDCRKHRKEMVDDGKFEAKFHAFMELSSLLEKLLPKGYQFTEDQASGGFK